MKLDAFDYDLPDGRIATAPARPREAAKLLDMTSADGFFAGCVIFQIYVGLVM